MQKIISKLGLNIRLTGLIPYFIFAILFIALPILLLVIESFSFGGVNGENWEVATSSSTIQILGRSVYVGLGTSILTLLISLPFAYTTSRLKSRIAKTWSIFLIISPLLVFTIAKVFALRGLLTAIFDESSLNSEFIIIIGLVYLNLPFFIIPLYSVMNSMPKSLVEASNDLGFGTIATFIKVVIPYSLRAILAGFSLVFMLASTSIVVSQKLIPASSQFQLIGNVIDGRAYATNSFEVSTASSISLIMILVISAIYILIYGMPLLIRKLRGGVNV